QERRVTGGGVATWTSRPRSCRGDGTIGAHPDLVEQLLDLLELLRGRRRGGQGVLHELERRGLERAVSALRVRGWRPGRPNRLAASRALGGRVDVPRQAGWSVGHPVEARQAPHVDDGGLTTALPDVHAEEVDAEGRPAPSGDVRELR